MSSWYVWSALGGYPETPGSADVATGSPLFPSIAVHLGNGKMITESAPRAADDAPYVQGLSIDGSRWNRDYLPASVFASGGMVDWTLGTNPSATWATAPGDAPPSSTQGLLPGLGSVTGPNNSTDSLVITAPGSSAMLNLGVQSMAGGAQTISWTALASSGSGLQIGPVSGSMVVGSEAKATQTVQVTAPASTPDGKYSVTFNLRTATGTALPPVVEEVAVARPGDLSPYYNNAGISSDSDQAAANYDGDGFSYSEQELAAQGVMQSGTVSSDGVQYDWPNVAPGQPDNVIAGGQTINLPRVPGASKIGIIGSATNGPSDGMLTITYTDGASRQVLLGFGDWTLDAGSEQPSYGNGEVAKMAYRNSISSTSETVVTYVFSATIPVPSGKTVASVTLPPCVNQGGLHVFAIGSDKGPLTG